MRSLDDCCGFILYFILYYVRFKIALDTQWHAVHVLCIHTVINVDIASIKIYKIF